jgi:tetratricopeptide (TPR) repeat protein
MTTTAKTSRRALRRPRPSRLDKPWLPAAICAGLAALIWMVFGGSLGFGFLNLDDPDYVTANPRVQAGLSLDNIVWAFTHLEIGLWTPVTTLSHMLDCQLFGLNPAGHHFTNLALHTVTAILLFLVLWRMTGAIWRSAFVAALFAVHPLRVESVAWIAERKDVLDGLFFMLTLAAYVHYARGKASLLRHSLVILALALGLMSKPMLATVPFLLLLLDYWPICRINGPPALRAGGDASPFRQESLPRLILEKVPLMIISALAVAVTVLGSKHATLAAFKTSSLPDRLGFGLAASLTYIRQMFWPDDAAVIHCISAHAPGAISILLYLLALATITAAVLIYSKKMPYLPAGWFWYLGMLVPVSGVVVLGFETQADRYTYLPQIGLYIMLTWLAADLAKPQPVLLGVAATAVILLFSGLSYAVLGSWRDSASLWQYTLDHGSDNVLAQENMGATISGQGRFADAIPYYQAALQLRPDYSTAHYDLGNALKATGRLDDAISEYREALRLKPDFAQAHNNLGNALQAQGNLAGAATELQAGLALVPDDPIASFNLGNVLQMEGQFAPAIARYQDAIRLKPSLAQAQRNMALAMLSSGDTAGATAAFNQYLDLRRQDLSAYMDVAAQLYEHRCYAETGAVYQQAVAIWPHSAPVLNATAWLLATCPDPKVRDGTMAVQLATTVNQMTGGKVPAAMRTLAAAYAEAGRFPDAISTAQAALPLAEAAQDHQLANSLREALPLYQNQQPYRQP